MNGRYRISERLQAYYDGELSGLARWRFQRRLARDPAARQELHALEETGRFLGIAVSNILFALNVERVVFTGGMTGSRMMLLKPIRDEAKRRVFPLIFKGVKIVFSKVGNDAGLIGAAGWALHRAEGDDA